MLTDDGLVLFEAAAITMHLADRHPQAMLAPPPGTPERGHFYKRMVYLTNTPQAEFMPWFNSWNHVADPEAADSMKQAAAARLDRMFDVISGQLGSGAWLLRNRSSAADLFLLMLDHGNDPGQILTHLRRQPANPEFWLRFARFRPMHEENGR